MNISITLYIKKITKYFLDKVPRREQKDQESESDLQGVYKSGEETGHTALKR